jgi:hypothetical protein
MTRTLIIASLAIFATSQANALNPQPLPPKESFGAITNPGTIRGLNPQPLPPKTTITNPGVIKGLNPQPLPPKTLGQ